MDRNWIVAKKEVLDISTLQPHVYRNHKTELSFSPQLIDKHTMTMLTRTIQPFCEEERRSDPQSKSGFIKATSVLSNLFKVHPDWCF